MAESIGVRIRMERARQRLSQQDLAARIGLTPSGLCLIEMDKNEPRSVTLKGLAQALAVSSDYLLGLSDTPRPSSSLLQK